MTSVLLASTAAPPRTTSDATRKHHVHGDGTYVDANECLLSAAVNTVSSLVCNWAQYGNT